MKPKYSNQSEQQLDMALESKRQYDKEEELELILRECEKQIVGLRETHIKNVILFTPWDGIAEEKKSSNSISTRTGISQQIQNIDNEQEQNQIITRNLLKLKSQEPSESESKSEQNKNTCKTKFRQMNRRRRVTGPQPDSFREQLIKIIEEETKRMNTEMLKAEESISKEEYYASDQEQSMQEMIPSRQRKRRSPLDLFLQSLPSAKVEEQTVQVPKGIICRHNLQTIFEQASLNIPQAAYTTQTNEDPFYQTAFEHFRQELAYKASNQRSSHHLSKGRLFMVRRAMEVYSHIQPKEHNQLRFVRNRLTKKEKLAFQKAKLPCPPCRLTTGFLGELFSIEVFARFFKQFVDTGMMQQILSERSQKEIGNFRIFYRQVANYEDRTQERMRLLCINPPPLSQLEVKLYMEQAWAICDRYCK